MKPVRYILIRLCAVVALVAGLIYAAWLYVTQRDTGGAVACVAGVLLIVSIVLNEG